MPDRASWQPRSIEDIEERLDEIRAELQNLDEQFAGRKFDDATRERWNDLNEEKVTREKALTELRARRNRLAELAGNPGSHDRGIESASTLPAAARYGGGGARDQAMRHLDDYVRRDELDARSAEKVARLMRGGDHAPLAQRWAAAGSDPDYVSAFFKAISGERGHMLWTPGEQRAYRRVEQVRSEMRAMSAGTTTTGGFQIPTIIDPSIRISSDGSISPIRQLAEVRQAMGSKFRPVTSAHVTNEWTAESAEVSDGTPTLASPEIDAFKSTSFVPFTFEYASAAFGGAIGDLTRLLVDGLDQLTAEAWLNGNGTTQPPGLWTGIDGTSSELSPATAETFADEDVYATQNALPPRFQPGATWQANIATINELSQSETTNGAPRFPRVGDEEPVLLRKRLFENSRMRGTDDIDAGATADNPVLIYGDIRQAYTIVDFAGSSVELVPHLFHTSNNRPSGERGLLLWARFGAGVVIDNAVRIMNVATTL